MDKIFVVFHISEDYWTTRSFCGACTDKDKVFDVIRATYLAYGYDPNDEDRFLKFYYEDIEVHEVPLNVYVN